MYDTLMRAFAHICAQDPQRSPHFFGRQFFLCYRCAGTYAALLLGLALQRLFRIRATAFRFHLGAALTAVCAALMLADVFVLQFYLPNNFSRGLSGILLGAALAFWIRQCLGALAVSRVRIR